MFAQCALGLDQVTRRILEIKTVVVEKKLTLKQFAANVFPAV